MNRASGKGFWNRVSGMTMERGEHVVGLTIEQLRKLCDEGVIQWTAHITTRMLQRRITREDVISAIRSGEIIEQYPDDYPFPSGLVLGLLLSGLPLHVVCGVGMGEVYMITCYTPNPHEWDSDFRRRAQR